MSPPQVEAAPDRPVARVIGIASSAGGLAALTAILSPLPASFPTGASAAAGIALINSVGNLSQLAGPYMIGAIAMRTGNLYTGLAIAGVPLFMAATLVLLLPRRVRSVAKG